MAIRYFNLIFRHRIKTTFREGLTAEEAKNREFRPDNDTMKTKRFSRVLGASGGEAAGKRVAKEGVAQGVVVRGDVFLVEGEHRDIIDLSSQISVSFCQFGEGGSFWK